MEQPPTVYPILIYFSLLFIKMIRIQHTFLIFPNYPCVTIYFIHKARSFLTMLVIISERVHPTLWHKNMFFHNFKINKNQIFKSLSDKSFLSSSFCILLIFSLWYNKLIFVYFSENETSVSLVQLKKSGFFFLLIYKYDDNMRSFSLFFMSKSNLQLCNEKWEINYHTLQ